MSQPLLQRARRAALEALRAGGALYRVVAWVVLLGVLGGPGGALAAGAAPLAAPCEAACPCEHEEHREVTPSESSPHTVADTSHAQVDGTEACEPDVEACSSDCEQCACCSMSAPLAWLNSPLSLLASVRDSTLSLPPPEELHSGVSLEIFHPPQENLLHA